MELGMWNDEFLLANEWGLDMPADPSNGLFGDLKAEGRYGGDVSPSFPLQDAVEHVSSASPSRDEDVLGLEWMESSDLGSFLSDLGGSSDKLLSLEASLGDYTFSTAPEELVSVDQFSLKEEPVALEEPSHHQHAELPASSGSSVQESLVFSQSGHKPQTVFDALVSPPSSPEQVAPVIKLDPQAAADSEGGLHATGLDLFNITILDNSTVLADTSFNDLEDENGTVVSFDDVKEFICSPLSAQDVESMLSESLPTSPSSTSECSIIESSPELYKVISTSSFEGAARFSPYSKVKSSKQAKTSRKTRSPAEPVPEHVILEQLNKKDRKKLQNKNAAIRYRMKKKGEAEGIKTEEMELEEINLGLKTKVEDLQREIKYMKNLMEDVCKAKGLL